MTEEKTMLVSKIENGTVIDKIPAGKSLQVLRVMHINEDVTDTVTIAYIVNGEISEINLLENILPWLENEKVVSSGPVFNAIQGELTDIHLEKSADQEIIIDIEGIKQEKTISDMCGEFLFETDIQFNDEPIRISIYSWKVFFY